MPKKKGPINCRWCDKEIPNRRHEVFCGSNPKRPAGASDEIVKKKRRADVAQDPAQSKIPSAPTTQATPTTKGGIQAVFEEIPKDSMPNFDGIDFGKSEARPQGAPAQDAPKQDQPNPADSIAWDAMANVVVEIFDRNVHEFHETTEAPKPPQPVTDEEKKKLGEALSGAMHAYGTTWAQFFDKYGPAINLAVVSGSIFGGRIIQARAYKKYQVEQKEQAKKRREQIREGQVGERIDYSAPEPPEEPATTLGDMLIRQQREIENDNATSEPLIA